MTSDKPPYYLMWFLIRIRRHSNEQGYLESRFDSIDDFERVGREVCMLRELRNLGMVALSESETEKILDTTISTPKPGVIKVSPGMRQSIPYPELFVVLPAGHYLIRELAMNIAMSASWTVATVLIGIIIGRLI